MTRDAPAALAIVRAQHALGHARDLICEPRWTPAGRAAIRAHAEAAIADLRAVVERLGADAMSVGDDPWGIAS